MHYQFFNPKPYVRLLALVQRDQFHVTASCSKLFVDVLQRIGGLFYFRQVKFGRKSRSRTKDIVEKVCVCGASVWGCKEQHSAYLRGYASILGVRSPNDICLEQSKLDTSVLSGGNNTFLTTRPPIECITNSIGY